MTAASAERIFVGVDLGGTNTKLGVVEANGTVLARQSIDTRADTGPEAVIDRICDAVCDVIRQVGLSRKDVAAVGIGSPGPISREKGMVSPANLPGWKNVPLPGLVSEKLRLPATLENDANAAAYGEFWAGAGRNCRSLAMFTLGTGIGGGIILDSKILHGAFDNAAEIGHMIVEPQGRRCNCGQRGCLEAYASASNAARIATEALQAGRESSMKRVLDAGRNITSEIILEHMLEGDALAGEIWRQTCRYLAIGSINIAHIINCELIVLAGGMAGAGEHLLAPVREYYRQLRWEAELLTETFPPIVLAELGNDAGFIGAAGAAMLALTEQQGNG